jgi:hypothetical protein
VQCYPASEQHSSSPIIRETGVAVAPGGRAANAATRRAAAGLALASPAQPTVAPPQPATPVVARGRPAPMTEIPVPTKAGAAVVTLPRYEESHGAAMCRQPEWHGPVPKVQILSGVTPIATRKRVSKCTLKKPLAGCNIPKF